MTTAVASLSTHEKEDLRQFEGNRATAEGQLDWPLRLSWFLAEKWSAS
jgi:hypothetical protein